MHLRKALQGLAASGHPFRVSFQATAQARSPCSCRKCVPFAELRNQVKCFKCGTVDSVDGNCPSCGRALPVLIVSPDRQSVSIEQLRAARAAAELNGTTVGSQLVELGFLSEAQLRTFLSESYGVPTVNLDEFELDIAVANLISEHLALSRKVVPVNVAEDVIIIAMCDPSNIDAIDEVREETGLRVEVVLASPDQIRRALAQLFPVATQ